MMVTLRWWNTLNHEIPKVRIRRERQIQIGTHFFFEKMFFFTKKIVPQKTTCGSRHRGCWSRHMMTHTKQPVDRLLVLSPSIPWRVFPSPCPRSVAKVSKKTSGCIPGLITYVLFTRQWRSPYLSLLSWRSCSEPDLHLFSILLWIKKARGKDKTYTWGSVWWKTQKLTLRTLHDSYTLGCDIPVVIHT